jgi:hypothetical protein
MIFNSFVLYLTTFFLNIFGIFMSHLLHYAITKYNNKIYVLHIRFTCKITDITHISMQTPYDKKSTKLKTFKLNALLAKIMISHCHSNCRLVT